jgi:23S rRNA (cytidine1920-2'-O)/16S rRNA (cytidine1409-2'-O)-methyltransferase
VKKERIDVLLVEQGFFDSREKAKRAIMAGIVHDDYDRIDKPGTKIPVDSNLHVKGQVLPYVSRGGLKLEKAIKSFKLDLKDVIMVDIGSSTGGFTDCALQNGAKKVYAIDVGTNQLVWKLRSDERVIVKEKTNFRYVTKDFFTEEMPTFATCDVSFISLSHIFEPLKDIFLPGNQIMTLIKPQFEAGRDEVGKKGIVKDPLVHEKVINNVINFANKFDFYIQNLDFSPITGGEGNIEFIALFTKSGINAPINVKSVVEAAHLSLKG